MTEDKLEIPHWVKSIPIALGSAAAIIGAMALLGWALNSQILKSIDPAFVTIKPNTALGLLLLGGSVAMLGYGHKWTLGKRISSVMALAVFAMGFLTIAEYIFSIDLAIDQLLFNDAPQSFDTVSPGRMAAITCFCFMMSGLALHTLAERYEKLKRLPDLLLIMTMLVAIFVLEGYLFESQELRDLGMYGGMAIHTAAAFLLLCLGALFIRPLERVISPLVSSTPAGVMLRWILPASIVTPTAVVWLRMYGEKMGWYSSGVAAAFSVVTMITLFAALSLMSAYSIDRAHRRFMNFEIAARANDQRLRCLLNNTPVAVYMKELNGQFSFANYFLEDLLAAPQGSLDGKTISDLFPNDPRLVQVGTSIEEHVLKTRTTVEQELEVQIGGKRRTFLSSTFPIIDESNVLIAIGGVSTDITELKRAEDHINRLFNLATNLVCIANTDGYFVRVNPAWEETFGYTRAELTGQPFMNFIHPDDIGPTQEQYQKQSAGSEVISFENRYRCKDGTYRTLLWSATPAIDGNLIFAVAHDITSRKAAEEEIAELNSALASRAAALEAANSELEAFSYSVSHDLRAPLRSIDGFSQALLEDYSGKLDHTADDYLRRVSAAAQRMGLLIDDLLQLSRISRSPLRCEQLDLSAMARAIDQELRERTEDRKVTTTIEGNIIAFGDPGLVGVLLSNLFNNAWKYTSKAAAAEIHFGSQRERNVTVFYIKDNGVGFDMAYGGKLFGAFQRLHSASEFAGTGIGLATVQRIVRRHGGRVWAESEVGKGATFLFTLKPSQRENLSHERQMHTVG